MSVFRYFSRLTLRMKSLRTIMDQKTMPVIYTPLPSMPDRLSSIVVPKNNNSYAKRMVNACGSKIFDLLVTRRLSEITSAATLGARR